MNAGAGTDTRAALILLAAGAGSRVGHDLNKVFLPLAGVPVVLWSVRAAVECPEIERVVLVVAGRDRDRAAAVLATDRPDVDVELVIGGQTRHQSEWAALTALAGEIEGGAVDVVVIHDAARPLAGAPIFTDVVEVAARAGAAVPARPRAALLPVDPATEPPAAAVAVQTPQAFRAQSLLDAYKLADQEGFDGTDTASCVERYSDLTVRWVPGTVDNVKLTFADDLETLERWAVAAHRRADITGPGPRS